MSLDKALQTMRSIRRSAERRGNAMTWLAVLADHLGERAYETALVTDDYGQLLWYPRG